MNLLQAFWGLIKSPLATDLENLYGDYNEFESGKPFTTPVEYLPLFGDGEVGLRATIQKGSTSEPIDLQPGYLEGLIASQWTSFIKAQVIVLPTFTIPFQGAFIDVTLKLQLSKAPTIGEPAGAPLPIAPPSEPPIPGRPIESGVSAELNKEFPL